MPKNNCFANTNPCSGCGACFAVCPVNAIQVNLNQLGFYEAFLDGEKCISCGLCVKVCTKYQNSVPSTEVINKSLLYAVWRKDKTGSAQSSSAGVAELLTKLALEEGYTAVGVIYDYSENRAKAVFTDNIDQAEAYKGSKYLQAATHDCYKEILSKEGKFIVFGTPCQIAGLDSALKVLNRRADFVLVDCFCHGVPSYLLWQAFLVYIGIEKPEKVDFRRKSDGWHNYFMAIEGNGKAFSTKVQKNPFYKLFFSDLLLNESCYACGVKTGKHSDIRLGDFWGSPYDLREDGVTAAIAISQTGKQWLNKIKDTDEMFFEEGNKKSCIKAQNVFRVTHLNKKRREQILDILQESNLKEALIMYNKSLSRKSKLAAFLKANLPNFAIRFLRFSVNKVRGI